MIFEPIKRLNLIYFRRYAGVSGILLFRFSSVGCVFAFT